jgi:hypothetical protein
LLSRGRGGNSSGRLIYGDKKDKTVKMVMTKTGILRREAIDAD